MYDHVLVGTDGSAIARCAGRAAARLTQVHQAKLTIAHAFDPRSHVAHRPPVEELEWMFTPGATAEMLVRQEVVEAHRTACGGLEAVGHSAARGRVG